MRLTLNEDFLRGATQVKGMGLLFCVNTNVNDVAKLQVNILKRKEPLSDQLELAANVGV